MKKITLAGVPEHFNLPWHLAYEEGVFEDVGIDLDFVDHPGGTGAMSQALKNGEVDLALLLTEGAVKFIAENPSFKMVQFYVDSPLLWGVHVPAGSVVNTQQDLFNVPFAISRYGSGSHLMAYVYAQQLGLDTRTLSFELIQNLEGLRAAYASGLDAVFLWEKFTTKPFVDGGEMKRIGVCPTPWPCFVLVAHQDFIAQHQETLSNLLDAINLTTDFFKDRPHIHQEIADRYELPLEDVQEWIADTHWSSSLEMKESVLDGVVTALLQLEILNKPLSPSQLVSSLTKLV